jgi:hypothetical protein
MGNRTLTSVSKLESKSERVESPKRRNPNKPVIT